MLDKVTLRQIAEATGSTKTAIEKRCAREAWRSCGTITVNHNKTKLYAVGDLPADMQEKLRDQAPSSQSSPAKGEEITSSTTASSKAPSLHCPAPAPVAAGAGILQPTSAGSSPASPEPSTGLLTQASRYAHAGTPSLAAGRAQLGSGEIVSTETGEVVNLGAALPAASDKEIDLELYAGLKAYAREKVDHILAVLRETAGMKGAGLGNYLKLHPEHDASYQTVLRWRDAYYRLGIAGIMPGWGANEGATSVHETYCRRRGLDLTTKIDDNAWFVYFKGAYLKEGAPSLKSCWTATLGHARAKDPTLRADEFPGPSAFKRLLDREVSESAQYMARYGKAAWNKRYANYIDRDYSALKPGEVIVSDHAQVDVAVLLPGGKVCFPWVTAWRCFKTGKWTGWLHHPEAPNSDHVFQSFYYSTRDHGLCSEVLIDNGKDYRVRDFAGGRKRHKVSVDEKRTTGMLALLDVTPHFALPYNAQTKPIERDFLRNKEWFSKHMPGYRGGNVVERPESLADEIKAGRILHWAEYVKLMDQYIMTISNKLPSDGKVLAGRCPDEAWDAERTEVRKIGPDALKLFCMRTSGEITIGRNGVLDSKLDARYWAEWMSGMKGAKVYIRRDIKEHQTAWVFRADNDEFLGKAELTGKVAALARTDVEKADLKNAMARKRQEQKITAAYFNKKDRPEAAESVANLAAGVAAVNEQRGYAPQAREEVKVLRLANTDMDKIIARERQLQATGTYDLSAIAPPEPATKQVIYLFECDKPTEE